MTADLPTALWLGALMRRVGAAGGFATVLARGTGDRAPALLLARDRAAISLWERVPDAARGAVWRRAADGADAADAAIARQRRFDPDLWVVELDIADAERFIGNSAGCD